MVSRETTYRASALLSLSAAVCAVAGLGGILAFGYYHEDRGRDGASTAAIERLAAETRALAIGVQTASGRDRSHLLAALESSRAALREALVASGDDASLALAAELDATATTAARAEAIETTAIRAIAHASPLDAPPRAPPGGIGWIAAALLGAALFGAAAAAANAIVRREIVRVAAALPPGAPGERLATRVERLTGRARHAFVQQTTLVGERVELARALREQQSVEERLRGEVREHREQIERLEVAQMNDELTGVLNFKYFVMRLGDALDDFLTTGREFCLLALDLDDFKSINDGYGHHVGDAALKALGGALQSSVRERDVVFRKSGDEFYVLMPDARGEHGEALAERLLDTINGLVVAYESGGERYEVSLATSIGVLSCDEVDRHALEALSRDQLVSETYGFADAALFKAKFSGKGCARIYHAGLTVHGVNPEEYPPEIDQLNRELRARYALLPEPQKNAFNRHVAACRDLLAPGRHDRQPVETTATPQ